MNDRVACWTFLLGVSMIGTCLVAGCPWGIATGLVLAFIGFRKGLRAQGLTDSYKDLCAATISRDWKGIRDISRTWKSQE